MAKTIKIVEQVKDELNKYIEEQRQQNAKRAEQEKLMADIASLEADAKSLKLKAKEIVERDKEARDAQIRPLCALLGLKVEDNVQVEVDKETRYDRDGAYKIDVRYLRGNANLVDKYGHTIFRTRIYQRFMGYESPSKEDIAEAKRSIKEIDVLTLFAHYLTTQDALSELKNYYLSPENWELKDVEKEIKTSVHDIGVDGVKETLKELKKQRVEVKKNVNSYKRELHKSSYYSVYDEGRNRTLKNLDKHQEELKKIDSKIAVHERAIDLYKIKTDLTKLVAKIKEDVANLDIVNEIDKVAPAQEKYIAVKAEQAKTYESVKEIQDRIKKMGYKNESLSSDIESDDKKISEDAVNNGKLTEIINNLVTEDFVNSSEGEETRRDCYVQMSTESASDKLEQKIVKEIFDRIELLSAKENEMA